MSNIHIARKHQSAPADTALDAAVKQAAEEIDSGRYLGTDDDAPAQALEGLGLSLSMGTIDQVRRATSLHGTEAQFQEAVDRTRDLNQLGRHPRVLEAIEKLKAEPSDEKTPEEQLEREWMLYEMTALQVQGNKWQGQQRWEGKDAEEMRIGRVMTPLDFMKKLYETIGSERVLCPPQDIARLSPEDKSGMIGIFVRNPRWDGVTIKTEYKRGKAAELMQRAQKLTLKCERYFNVGMTAEATKLRGEVIELTEAATQLQMEASQQEWREPELLRVGSLQWPLMTEWMVMHFDEYGVPYAAKYKGWRTALLTMIRTHAITEEEAHKAFPVGSGPAAAWYLEQLYLLRNRVQAAETVQ